MHLVTAIIKAHRVEEVTDALKEVGVSGMTIGDVQGFGRQRGHTEVYRGSEYRVDFVPKVRVDVLCDDAQAEKVADVIADAARTGKIGDGKIWITEVARAIRIRTGETGEDALCTGGPGAATRLGPTSRTGNIRVMRMSDGVEWGVHVCTLLAALAVRRRTARSQARRVSRRAACVSRQAPAGLGACRRARDGEGSARRLPPRAAAGRDHAARRRRGDRRRRARISVHRDPAARAGGDAGARVHEAVRHPRRVRSCGRGVARGARVDLDRGSLRRPAT